MQPPRDAFQNDARRQEYRQNVFCLSSERLTFANRRDTPRCHSDREGVRPRRNGVGAAGPEAGDVQGVSAVAVQLWQRSRPKGRSPLWAFRVLNKTVVVFESAWVSVRYQTREDALWLANLIESLAERELFGGCPGHRVAIVEHVSWSGDLGDDCVAVAGDLSAHAEHLFGPSRGGAWYCSVSEGMETIFHTVDCGIRPRSGAAARWLCEVVMCSRRA